MNIITGRVNRENNVRGYIWYDTTIPNSGYRFKWSLTYAMIPEPKIFSEEYIAMYPNEFHNPSIIERILIFLKLKKHDPRRRFKQS
jgi:hypothetical protein